MQIQNISKFTGHCPIFTAVIAKKNIKQTDKFIAYNLRKFLERDHDKAKIFPTRKKKSYQNQSILQKNIGEQTLIKYTYRRTV